MLTFHEFDAWHSRRRGDFMLKSLGFTANAVSATASWLKLIAYNPSKF